MSWKLLPWWPGRGAFGFGPQWFLLLPLPCTCSVTASSSCCSWGKEEQLSHTVPPEHWFFKVPARFCCCWGSRVHDYLRLKFPSVTVKVYLRTNTSCAALCTCRLKIHDNDIRRGTLKCWENFITFFEKHQTPPCLNLKCAPSWARDRLGREVHVLQACPLVNGNGERG